MLAPRAECHAMLPSMDDEGEVGRSEPDVLRHGLRRSPCSPVQNSRMAVRRDAFIIQELRGYCDRLCATRYFRESVSVQPVPARIQRELEMDLRCVDLARRGRRIEHSQQ